MKTRKRVVALRHARVFGAIDEVNVWLVQLTELNQSRVVEVLSRPSRSQMREVW